MNIRFADSIDELGLRPELDRWRTGGLMARLWSHDGTVFAPEGTPEITNRLDWLELPQSSRAFKKDLEQLRTDAVDSGVATLVLCGMGGSSLAPEVFSEALGSQSDVSLTVIDTTHPDALARVLEDLEPSSTWFVISSKSGTTIETISSMNLFWHHMAASVEDPGRHFIAVTDPASPLIDTAEERGFRATFEANPNVGGRYSAFTHFGLVPAAILGIDTVRLLDHAGAAADMCGPDTPLESNPAFLLGGGMAVATKEGIDKARFVGDGAGAFVGAWAEQLIAESTGKDGTGIIPVDDGPHRPSADDEFLISVGTTPNEDADVSITLSNPYAIASVMYLLELATAVAGEILGIHPFNQPDVQRAKELAGQAMAGELEADHDPVSIRDADIGQIVLDTVGGDPSYVSIQAYVDPTPEADEALDRLRTVISERSGIATTVGYGPRFLHSTGQLHKGGPAGGAFLQLIDSPSRDVGIPDSEASFGDLISGQATGDRSALEGAGRTVVTVDLHDHPVHGIIALANRLER